MLLLFVRWHTRSYTLEPMGKLFPVVRRLEAKFRKPARGRVCARAPVAIQEVERWSAKLAGRGRVLAPVTVEVVDAAGVIVLSAVVEWFIAREALGVTSS